MGRHVSERGARFHGRGMRFHGRGAFVSAGSEPSDGGAAS